MTAGAVGAALGVVIGGNPPGHRWLGATLGLGGTLGVVGGVVPPGGAARRGLRVILGVEQRTRPQTSATRRPTPPAGLAAWIVEKIDSWTDPRGRLRRDAVLDNVMHYWPPRTGRVRRAPLLGKLERRSRWLGGPLEQRVPRFTLRLGCSIFPYELQRPTRQEAEQRFTDIHYWNLPELGGHFPAWEQPHIVHPRGRGILHALPPTP